MIKLSSILNFLLVALAAASTVLAQGSLSLMVGVFPHYAVGNEWSSTIYFDVAGTGRNNIGTQLLACSYKLEFYNQTGAIQHTERFSRSSFDSFRSNVVKIVVPDFGYGQLVYGPAVLSSDCSMVPPVRFGELVFSQRVGDKTNDGTVKFKVLPDLRGENPTTLIDMDKFVYGFAVYSSWGARTFRVSVRDVATNTTILKEKLLFTLAGKEQKIFVLTDLVPELKGRKGMYIIHFSHSVLASMYDSPVYMVLKFNSTDLFSTGFMYSNPVY